MKKELPRVLVSNKKGKIFDIPELEAVGMKAGKFFRLKPSQLIKLPYASSIFMLPNRSSVGYNSFTDSFVALKERYSAIAAFVSPGYTICYNSAYIEDKNPKALPLFAYSAVCFYKNGFYVPAVNVDRDRRQDCRLMDINKIRENTVSFQKLFPKNRLITHLKTCALNYNCPAAKNFFLHRAEAPLPSSTFCNCQCFGCISYQPRKRFPVTQPRITFLPCAEEIAEAALWHINNTKFSVVSFGQGCEGEPLLVYQTLVNAVKLIRAKTSKGIINLNTNASVPFAVGKLFDAGLDSIRVSLNSVRQDYYQRYYRPKGYNFFDVLRSMRIAKNKSGFVSLNYLTIPGFTDSKQEFQAFKSFIEDYKIDMLQWRNLNYDPLLYFKDMKINVKPAEMLGIQEIISAVKKEFPAIKMGYFNPAIFG